MTYFYRSSIFLIHLNLSANSMLFTESFGTKTTYELIQIENL